MSQALLRFRVVYDVRERNGVNCGERQSIAGLSFNMGLEREVFGLCVVPDDYQSYLLPPPPSSCQKEKSFLFFL